MTFFEHASQRMKTRVVGVIKGQMGLVLGRVGGGLR